MCMVAFAIDSIGTTGGACLSDGLISEGDMAMRSNVRVRSLEGKTNEEWTIEECVADMRKRETKCDRTRTN